MTPLFWCSVRTRRERDDGGLRITSASLPTSIGTMAVKQKRETAPAIIRNHLGEDLNALYVVSRDPVSGHLYEPFGLLALVEMERWAAYDAGGELATKLIENGFELPVKVLPESKGPPDESEAIEV